VKARAVAVLSGGLDSTVSVALAKRAGVRFVRAIFFDYGQRARARERDASRAVARRFRIPWREIRLPWLAAVTSTGLVSGRIPRVAASQLDDPRAARRTAAAVWVPNRNGVFLNIAAAVAEGLGARLVVTGFDREEARTFPDNSTAFLRAANRAFRYSTSNGVRARSFVAALDKRQIVERGLQVGAPLELVWSCYEGRRRPCGRCESCARSRRAFGSTQ
jgi:7-cyano-7-deazaguanine synthase